MDLSNAACLIGGAVIVFAVEDATRLARRWWNRLTPVERDAVERERPFDWAEDDQTVVDLFFDRDSYDEISASFRKAVRRWARTEQRASTNLYGIGSNNVIALPVRNETRPVA